MTGTQAAVLPGPYREAFSSFSDSAPSVPFEDILPIFAASFNGAHPDDIFDDFERTPLASASIAQVHRAKLKDGTEVAVKVQKPEIQLQVEWDLRSYRTCMWLMQASSLLLVLVYCAVADQAGPCRYSSTIRLICASSVALPSPSLADRSFPSRTPQRRKLFVALTLRIFANQ